MAAAAAQAAVQAVVATQQQPNSVLRVIVENLLYPVSLDVLYQVSLIFYFSTANCFMVSFLIDFFPVWQSPSDYYIQQEQ